MGVFVDLIAKNFLTSKRFWGFALAMVPIVGQQFGFHITDADASQTVHVLSNIWTEAWGLVALYGGWTAKGPLTVGASKVVTVTSPAP